MAAELYRLVWTRIRNGQPYTLAGQPTSRDEALREFDNCREIRRSCSLGQGSLRVMSVREYEARKAAH